MSLCKVRDVIRDRMMSLLIQKHNSPKEGHKIVYHGTKINDHDLQTKTQVSRNFMIQCGNSLTKPL